VRLIAFLADKVNSYFLLFLGSENHEWTLMNTNVGNREDHG
jgi:hypothetical protein